MAFIRGFGQALGNHLLVFWWQDRQIGCSLKMLKHQLANIAASERTLTSEQLLVDNGQAVLIGKTADPAVKSLRRGINRSYAAGHRGHHAFQILHAPEIG